MKDLPITLRIAILVALALSLAFIIGRFGATPSEEKLSGIIARQGTEVAEKPVAPSAAVLYPPVPAVLPDLNDNYLFNQERRFEEVAADGAPNGSGGVDLAEVSYSGSWVVGEVPKALIVYQEKSPQRGGPVSMPRGATRARPSVTTVTKHQQLQLDENFMGYVVEKIERDRIVFRKGDEVVEKFLHDQNKDRVEVGTVTQASPAGAVSVPGPVAPTGEQVPAPRAVNSGRSTPRSVTDVGSRRTRPAPADRATPSAPTPRDLKSERLLELVPSLGVPPLPGVPGDPLRRR